MNPQVLVNNSYQSLNFIIYGLMRKRIINLKPGESYNVPKNSLIFLNKFAKIQVDRPKADLSLTIKFPSLSEATNPFHYVIRNRTTLGIAGFNEFGLYIWEFA